MGIIEDIGNVLKPHTDRLVYAAQGIESRMCEIENRVSSLARPDVGDIFYRIIRKGKFKVEPIRLGQPRSGEYWMVQMFTTNGFAAESPAFTIRTNAGALIIAALPKGTGQEPVNGDVAVLPGEELIFEPSEEGTFDFTIHLIRRKIPQHIPNAVGGVNQGDQVGIRGVHEPDRYLPDIMPGWQGVDVPEEIAGDTSETQYGGVPPELADA